MRTPFNRNTQTQRRVFRDGHWVIISDPADGRTALALAQAALGIEPSHARETHTLASVRAVFGF